MLAALVVRANIVDEVFADSYNEPRDKGFNGDVFEIIAVGYIVNLW